MQDIEEQYCAWLEENEEEILIELAETGADRENGFNIEAEFEKRYQAYLDTQIVKKTR